MRTTLEGIAEQARVARAEFADMAAHQVDGGGVYPTRFHTNALAMRFMVEHFTHIIDWSNWALDATRDWPDTKTPATTWAAEASAIFHDAARHANGDDSEPAATHGRERQVGPPSAAARPGRDGAARRIDAVGHRSRDA